MILAQYAWLVMLALILVNVPFLWRRVRPHIALHPELEPGYRRLIWGGVFWASLPFLVMGVGCTVGGIPSFVNYFYPARGGPYVWAFWAVAYAEFLLLGYWAVWRGGAETLLRHPGLGTLPVRSVRGMKWFVGGFAVFAVVWNTAILIWAEHKLV